MVGSGSPRTTASPSTIRLYSPPSADAHNRVVRGRPSTLRAEVRLRPRTARRRPAHGDGHDVRCAVFADRDEVGPRANVVDRLVQGLERDGNAHESDARQSLRSEGSPVQTSGGAGAAGTSRALAPRQQRVGVRMPCGSRARLDPRGSLDLRRGTAEMEIAGLGGADAVLGRDAAASATTASSTAASTASATRSSRRRARRSR